MALGVIHFGKNSFQLPIFSKLGIVGIRSELVNDTEVVFCQLSKSWGPIHSLKEISMITVLQEAEQILTSCFASIFGKDLFVLCIDVGID